MNMEHPLTKTKLYKTLINKGIEVTTNPYRTYSEIRTNDCNFYVYTKITIGEKDDNTELALWHEAGHAEHPYGLLFDVLGETLTRELAANTWLLENYEGQETEKDIIKQLRKWIMSYINDGHDVALHEETLGETA